MIFPRKAEAIIFDMDGLIFDTEALQFRAAQAAAKSHGRDLPLEVFRKLIGTPANSNDALLIAHFGEAVDYGHFDADWRANFADLVESSLALKPGVSELLDLLDDLKIPRAIATSSQRQNADHHLAQHGLEHRFHAVIAWGDYKSGKPAPDPFETAARRLGHAPEYCASLEDSYAGIRSAAAAGTMPVMVPDLLPANDEMRSLAVHVAKDLHEVREILLP